MNRLANNPDRLQQRRERERMRSAIQQHLQLNGYTYGDANTIADVVAGVTADSDDLAPTDPVSGIKWSAVYTGVATGVAVWLATKLLDRMFGFSKP